MPQVEQGSLVLMDCHTSTPKVFWQGVEVQGVKSIFVNNDGEGLTRVELTLHDDPNLARMQQLGIVVTHDGNDPPLAPT